jgi:cytochrome c
MNKLNEFILADIQSPHSAGKSMISENVCNSCHLLDMHSVGPAYTDVAKKYPNEPEILSQLVNKVIQGAAVSGGRWP